MRFKNITVIIFTVLFLIMLLCSCAIGGTGAASCAIHRDLDKNLYCDVCAEQIAFVCPGHTDADHDGICDTERCSAGVAVTHIDEDHNGFCDAQQCRQKMSVTHTDGNADLICDECGKSLAEICDECADENADGACDRCGGKVEAPTVCEHTDGNFDGKCDLCKQPMSGVVQMYANNRSSFKFVLSSDATSDTAYRVDMLIKELSGFGISVEKGEDTVAGESEYEVLFGNPKNRADEYRLDPHDYGAEGYAVKLVGTKIVIVSGSEGSFRDAIAAFKESFLGITGETKRLSERYISAAQNVVEFQDDYIVNRIELLGEDIRGYSIVAKSDSIEYEVALDVQSLLYLKCGYWLDIVDSSSGNGEIRIALAEKSGGLGYFASFGAGRMDFVCEYATVIETEVVKFFKLMLSSAKGTLEIGEADSYEKNVRDVYYSDFGAVGDGVTDDLAAIIATHEYANKGGHTVYATPGHTYYIGNNNGKNHFESAKIMTDTVWTGAKFIIDDSEISRTAKNGVYARECAIFYVVSSHASKSVNSQNLGIASLPRQSDNIGYAPGYKALVHIVNNNQKNYIRYGVNQNSGSPEQEVVLVDEYGNIDPSTPLMWDYEQITKYVIYNVQDEPLIITGGSFTTIYNREECVYEPYSRSITLRRSNVTLRDIEHTNIGEGETGCPSGGFTIFRTSYNLLFENIVYDNMKSFYQEKNGSRVLMGSYEIAGQLSVAITWKNCTQSDFYRDEEKKYAASGGIMGTSFNKNLTFDGCRLSSFDAHCGVWNVTIKDSEIEHINCIGGGVARIENTKIHTMYQKNAIMLRGDYGSLWMGDFYFIDCTLITENSHEVALFDVSWANHDFGFDYGAMMPRRIYVENITIESEARLSVLKLVEENVGMTSASAQKDIWKYAVWESQVDGVENLNPYLIAEEWIVKDTNGYGYLMPEKFTTKLTVTRE